MILSFLIPAYNCETTIDETVTSVLNQTLPVDSEVVIVDDGSADSTADRMRAWEGRANGRVRLGFHDGNRGGAVSRNTAASLARGDAFYMVDADNVLPPGCVATQLELLNRSDLDAVSVGHVYFFEGAVNNIVDGWVLRQVAGRGTVEHLFESIKVPPAHGNYLYTRRLFETVGGYPVDAGAKDTWNFGLRHLARGFDIAIDHRVHYLHRLHPPGNDSYWTREERRGTNSVNAIRACQRELALLPPRLGELVAELKPHDDFTALITSGAFSADVDHLRRVRRRGRVERGIVGGLTRVSAGLARLRSVRGSTT